MHARTTRLRLTSAHRGGLVLLSLMAGAAGCLAGGAETNDPMTDEGSDAITAPSSAAVSSAPAAAPTPGTAYTIVASHSGKCVEVGGSSRDNGGKVQQWGCWSGVTQQWKLTSLGGTAYKVVNVNSGKCLDVADGGTANGTNVFQWDCLDVNNQRWDLVDAGGGLYSLRAAHSQKCLDVSGGETGDGANVLQWDCLGGPNQKFRLTPPGGSGGNTRTYQMLLLVHQNTSIHQSGLPAIDSSIPQDNVDAVTQSIAAYYPQWVNRLSEGRLGIKLDVVVSKTPVRHVTKFGDNSYAINASDVADDVAQYIPAGKYDGIINYFRADNGSAEVHGPIYGWTGWRDDAAHGAGWTVIYYAGDNNRWRDQNDDWHAGVVHEWLHELEGYCQGHNVAGVPGLHDAAMYGYGQSDGGLTFWRKWYSDYMLRRVKSGSTLMGLGEPCFALPMPRSEEK